MAKVLKDFTRNTTTRRGMKSPRAPDINLSEIARQSGFTRTTISRVVNGHVQAGRNLLFKLAGLWGVSVEEADRLLKSLSETKIKQTEGKTK